MRERRLILDQQLSRLEAEKVQIDGSILEIYRRLEILDEVQSWNLLTEQEGTAESPATDQMENDGEGDIEWVRADPTLLSVNGAATAEAYQE
jgi:hypothetical protein